MLLIRFVGQIIARQPVVGWAVVLGVSIPAALGWLGYRLVEQPPADVLTPDVAVAFHEAQSSFAFQGLYCAIVAESDDFFTLERFDALHGAAARLRRHPSIAGVVFFADVPPRADAHPPSARDLWRLVASAVGRWLQPNETPAERPYGASIIRRGGLSASQLESVRTACARHPLIAGQLLSRDGKTLLLPLVLSEFSDAVTDDIRRIANEELSGSGIRVRLTGSGPLWQAHRQAYEADHWRLQIMAYVLVFALALIIFRGLPAILIAASGPVLGGFWTLGLLQFVGEPPNELTDPILPVLVIMIGFTDGVHLVVRVRHLRAGGLAPREAAAVATGHVGCACALTSLTTAIGFGSLMLTGSPVIRGFGRSAAIGVLLTFVAVILVIPLLSAGWLGRHIDRGQERDLVGRIVRRSVAMIDFVARRARLFAAAGVAATVLLVAAGLRLTPDDRLADRIPHNTEAWQALHHCDGAFGGIRFLQVLIEWPADAGADDIWRILEATEQAVDAEPLLTGTLSIRQWLTVMPGRPSPQKLRLAALLPAEHVTQFWRPDARRSLVVARMQDLGMTRYQPVIDRLRERLGDLELRFPGLRVAVTGDALVEGQTVRRLAQELAESLAIAGAIILVVLAAAMRSVSLGLIAVLPNIFPLAATAAVRAWLNPSLDIASACALVVSLGIAVDDTIHFLAGYQHEVRAGHDPPAACRRTFLLVGSALVMTTLVLMAGFGVVMTSSLPTHRLFAVMACTTIGAALVADLVILPALLIALARVRRSL